MDLHPLVGEEVTLSQPGVAKVRGKLVGLFDEPTATVIIDDQRRTVPQSWIEGVTSARVSLCEWCDEPAAGVAKHNDNAPHRSCGKHGLPDTFVAAPAREAGGGTIAQAVNARLNYDRKGTEEAARVWLDSESQLGAAEYQLYMTRYRMMRP